MGAFSRCFPGAPSPPNFSWLWPCARHSRLFDLFTSPPYPRQIISRIVVSWTHRHDLIRSGLSPATPRSLSEVRSCPQAWDGYRDCPAHHHVPSRPIRVSPHSTMAQSSIAPVNSATPQSAPGAARDPITSQRSLRQLSVFLLGSACLVASTAITRRAVFRRQLRIQPKFYEPNTNPHEFFSPFHDALQALNMATMNCTSVGIMLLGGTMWSFDIANIKEARSILRRRLNYQHIYKSEDDVPNSIGETLLKAGETRIVQPDEDQSEGKTQQ
jgi:hypothetical protein